MSEPLISIIIPVYNVEKYLKECLDSVLAQTYQNWEAICVDDGSPDNSGTILDDYAKKDKRFVVIHKSNEGTAIARTTAIAKSEGEYITFLDSDDAYAPTFLEDLYNASKTTNADVVWCERVGGENLPIWPEEKNIKNQTYSDVFYKFISKKPSMGMSLWNKLYKKELFTNIIEVPHLPTGEDLALLYQLMFNAKTVTHVAKHLYFYRKRPNSAMTSKFSQRNIDGEIGLRKYLFEIFKNKNITKKTRKSLNTDIAKALQNVCFFVPIKQDKLNAKQWHNQTIPLLMELELEGVYQPNLLPIKRRLKEWWILRRVK